MRSYLITGVLGETCYTMFGLQCRCLSVLMSNVLKAPPPTGTSVPHGGQ